MDNKFEISASKLPRQIMLGGIVFISAIILMWVFMGESKAKSHDTPRQHAVLADYTPRVPELREPPKSPQEVFSPKSSEALESRRQAPLGVFHTSYTPVDDSASQGIQFIQARARKMDNLKYTIIQGKVITAILETAINSDIPGMIRAIVKEDVFAEKGHEVLIPKGSRLIGEYHSDLELGQHRIYIGWKRVIRPDGIDIDIDSPGTDKLGRAGLTGNIDSKFSERFRDATLMSIISAGAATLNVGKSDEFNSMSAYREGVADSFATTANDILNRTKDLGPTIHVNQGGVIKIFVAKDLNFEGVINAS